MGGAAVRCRDLPGLSGKASTVEQRERRAPALTGACLRFSGGKSERLEWWRDLSEEPADLTDWSISRKIITFKSCLSKSIALDRHIYALKCDLTSMTSLIWVFLQLVQTEVAQNNVL
jgi:hypothetical protein